jgi:hypothetical protein
MDLESSLQIVYIPFLHFPVLYRNIEYIETGDFLGQILCCSKICEEQLLV